MFLAAAFLISVPVFIQAPLVRSFPWLSLLATVGLFGGSLRLRSHPTLGLWGDLLFGFAWTWLAGSIYWGWLRWEPTLHLPIEALGLPIALIGLSRGWGKVGHWFYLGSLFGTVITDLYFYLVELIPHWRQLMVVDVADAPPIFAAALGQMQTSWGTGCAAALVAILLVVGVAPLRSRQLQWWAFGGAVLSTLLVDGLFWLVASLA